jgi:autoinducer 2-degrading protein
MRGQRSRFLLDGKPMEEAEDLFKRPGAASRLASFVVSVTIWVKPAQIAEFIEATFDNARNTRLEPGNVRFDVLQSEEDPARFLLYEAYREREDFTKHQQTPHYLVWKNAVGGMMAQPRQGIKHKVLFFGDAPAVDDEND